jgi:hypothetical protein
MGKSPTGDRAGRIGGFAMNAATGGGKQNNGGRGPWWRPRSRSRNREEQNPMTWEPAATSAIVAGAVEAFRNRKETGPWTDAKSQHIAAVLSKGARVEDLAPIDNRDPAKTQKKDDIAIFGADSQDTNCPMCSGLNTTYVTKSSRNGNYGRRYRKCDDCGSWIGFVVQQDVGVEVLCCKCGDRPHKDSVIAACPRCHHALDSCCTPAIEDREPSRNHFFSAEHADVHSAPSPPSFLRRSSAEKGISLPDEAPTKLENSEDRKIDLIAEQKGQISPLHPDATTALTSSGTSQLGGLFGSLPRRNANNMRRADELKPPKEYANQVVDPSNMVEVRNNLEDDGNVASHLDIDNSDITQCKGNALHLAENLIPYFLPNLCRVLETKWEQVHAMLPEAWKWDLEYNSTYTESHDQHGAWTCTPLEPDEPKDYPLSIADAPVVLPVEYRWPPIGGVTSPPDPRPSEPIDCRTKIPLPVIRNILLTFEGSIGFYLLINGLLQIIVPNDFDTTWASSHLPHRYGGLKVCYIDQMGMEPTMLPSTTETSKANSSFSSSGASMASLFRPTRPATGLLAPSLKLNDFIEARPRANHRKDKYSGRIGLKVMKDGEPYVLMSTHVITEAILAKSHRDLVFGRDRFKKLESNWDDHVELWAGNERVSAIFPQRIA